MAETGQFFLLRPPADGLRVLAGRHGDLEFSRERAKKPADFTAWDCFDGSVRGSGQLLVERGKKLYLFGKSGVLVQSAKRKGNFLKNLRPGPVREALSGLFPLRCLLPVADGKLTVDRYLASWAQVPCGTLTQWRFCGPFGAAGLIDLQIGPGPARATAVQVLRKQGAAAAAPGKAYGLLAPGRPVYTLKPPVPLVPGQPALEAAAAIIRSCLLVTRQNEPGIVSDLDTEFLHDYRISLRRIRSVLSLFKGVFADDETARLKQEFSGLMAATGRLRDLDVYLLERQRYLAQMPVALLPGLRAMFQAFEAERQQCHQQLALHLAGAAYKWKIAALQAGFAEGAVIAPGPKAADPALEFAQKLIWKRYGRVCRIAEGIVPDSPDSEVHALRISCKKLRYLMELFAPLFPAAELMRVLKPLKRLQDTLGDFNDCSVQQAALLGFAQSPAASGASILSAGALIAVLEQKRLRARMLVEEKFQGFNSPETQAVFQALFHG